MPGKGWWDGELQGTASLKEIYSSCLKTLGSASRIHPLTASRFELPFPPSPGRTPPAKPHSCPALQAVHAHRGFSRRFRGAASALQHRQRQPARTPRPGHPPEKHVNVLRVMLTLTMLREPKGSPHLLHLWSKPDANCLQRWKATATALLSL